MHFRFYVRIILSGEMHRTKAAASAKKRDGKAKKNVLLDANREGLVAAEDTVGGVPEVCVYD
jgi:hypothetical protein